ncbi:MAG: hypothetical protein ACFCUQ_14635 [Kiloniellales bacterium]
MPSDAREYVVRCDGAPRRLIVLRASSAARFCAILCRRFPQHDWSLAERFLPQGAD